MTPPPSAIDNFLQMSELYYKSFRIGELVGTESDFPRSNSKLSLDEKLNDEIREYISNCKEAEKFSETDQSKYEMLLQNLENKFNDYVDSSDWFIMNSHGNKEKILSPIFLPDDTITWQHDF